MILGYHYKNKEAQTICLATVQASFFIKESSSEKLGHPKPQ